jgi:hypothetical protein
MSAMPRDEEYHLNFEGSNALEEQLERIRRVLGRLAAGLAGMDPDRPADLRDLVERQHVLQAADLLLGPNVADKPLETLARRGSGKCVFISYATKDEDFARELAARLKKVHVSYFMAKQTIPAAAEWAVYIWQAITGCQVFVPLLSAASRKRDWCKYEIGAALGQKKQVVGVTLDASGLPQVLKHVQITFKFRTEEQKRALVRHLKDLCAAGETDPREA